MSAVRFHLQIVTFLATFTVRAASAYAGDSDFASQKKALDIIVQFAERLCITVPLEGTAGSTELSRTAKAELNNVLSKIANLGVEGAAKYQGSEYQGVLQKDLAKLLRDTTDCRIQVWNDLKDKLILSSVKTDLVTNDKRESSKFKDVFVLTAIVDDPNGYTNVRRKQSVSSEIVSKVNQGEKFYTYRQDGNWWQIKTWGGKIGYMHVSRIKIIAGQ